MLKLFFLIIFISTSSEKELNLDMDYYDYFFGDYLIRSRRDGLPTCNEDKLMTMLANIQIVNPENIVDLATETAPSVCEKLETNVKTMNEYLQTCKPSTQADLYFRLIKGVQQLFNSICENRQLKPKYKSSMQCIGKQDFKSCSGPPDWNENSEREQVCKAYLKIIDCYKEKASSSCKEEGAREMLTQVVKDVITSVLPVHCPEIGSGVAGIEIERSRPLKSDVVKQLDDDFPSGDDTSEAGESKGKAKAEESWGKDDSRGNTQIIRNRWTILLPICSLIWSYKF